jgi:hypothetical protein
MTTENIKTDKDAVEFVLGTDTPHEGALGDVELFMVECAENLTEEAITVLKKAGLDSDAKMIDNIRIGTQARSYCVENGL